MSVAKYKYLIDGKAVSSFYHNCSRYLKKMMHALLLAQNMLQIYFDVKGGCKNHLLCPMTLNSNIISSIPENFKSNTCPALGCGMPRTAQSATPSRLRTRFSSSAGATCAFFQWNNVPLVRSLDRIGFVSLPVILSPWLVPSIDQQHRRSQPRCTCHGQSMLA